MQSTTKRVLTRFLICAFIGLLIEVFFTWSGRFLHGNLSGHGHTSPLMMIDYGLLGVIIMPLARPMIRKKIPLVFRAIVYMLGIYAVEFVSGWLFDLCGIRVWGYGSHVMTLFGKTYPANLCGYITLYYAPFWWILGLFAEYLNKKVDAVAVVLLSGATAQQLEEKLSK